MDSLDYKDVDNLIEEALNDSQQFMATDDDGDVPLGAARSALQDCFNSTLFETYIRGVVKNVTTLSRAEQRAIEGDPLVYIIAVLIFYSCGIVVLMINYMKKVMN